MNDDLMTYCGLLLIGASLATLVYSFGLAPASYYGAGGLFAAGAAVICAKFT